MKRVCWRGEPSRLACIALLAGILAVTAQPWNDDAPGTRLVQSALQLRDALADATVAEVLVNTSIVINGTAWRPVEVTRSLTVRATRALLKANRYAVVDFGTTVMLFSLGSGNVLTWIGIDVYTSHATLGPVFRPLRQSPGSVLSFKTCIIHRLVGVPYEAGITNTAAIPRPAGYPGVQRASRTIGNITLLTTDLKPRVLTQVGILDDFAAYIPPDSSLAGQNLFFGDYVVLVHDSYFLIDYFANATCLATRPGIECLAILLDEVEADKARKEAAQQAAADSGSGGGDNTATIVVAVVVPVGTVLLAALLGSIWWVRRNRRRELEQQQRAKAAADKAADLEAGGPREKTGTGGARLGVLARGVQNGVGGVFLGINGEKDLPEWSEAAHHEADDLGDMEQPAPATGLAGNGGRGADSVAIMETIAEAISGASSTSLQLPPAQPAPSAEYQTKVEAHQLSGPLQASVTTPGMGQHLPPDVASGKQAAAPDQTGADISTQSCSQRARLKPALSCALNGSEAPALVSVGLDGQADTLATECALFGSAGGTVDIKVPERAPSPQEVVAELGALVKELRGNIGHVAIVLEGVLGHGSFGTVYKGTWQGLPVAVKTVVFSATQESRNHALKEAALCQSIVHPNVIATYGSELQPIGVLPPSAASSSRAPRALGDPSPPPARKMSDLNIKDWRLYIIQEFADGGPLGNLYGHRALWLSPGVVNLAAVVPLALGIARALAHLHSKRIVHGDLNPNNVLLKRDPAEPSGYGVKVGDFGLSVMLPHDRTHLSNIRMGTMFYICPAVACKGRVGPAADVFSLGVILWELYHGRRAGVRTQEGPRYCSNFPAFPPTCPEVYKAVTLQCLQRQPQNRPPATVIVGALEHLLANLNPVPPPETVMN